MNLDPRSPCPYPPRSYGKLLYLRLRAAAGLPLFLAADAEEWDAPAAPQGLYRRLPCVNHVAAGNGPLAQPEAKRLLREVVDGLRSDVEVAGHLGLPVRNIRVAVARLRRELMRRAA